MGLKGLFAQPGAIIGMVHVGALPGTPRAREPLGEIAARAAAEAALYAECGVDAVLIENMHDVPYLKGRVGPEIVAAMTAIGCAVRQACPLPVGVQVLAAANREALAVALACGARFVRVENFVFGQLADEGLMETASAGPLLRYQRQIGAEHIRIIADIEKKHASHALSADLPLAEWAQAAEFFGADAVSVTGRCTGSPADADDVRAARGAVEIGVVVGSGVNADNLATLWPHADAFIVGSCFKAGGQWDAPVERERVRALMRLAAELRGRPA